jgi:two-component system, NtrC family, sensor histidine kinase PilS
MLDTIEGSSPKAAIAAESKHERSSQPATSSPESWHDALYAMGRLSASIVHDLRNPIAAICVSSEMLLDGDLAPTQIMRLASSIYRAANRMRETLTDLAYGMPGSSENMERCNLAAVIAESCEAASTAGDPGIEIHQDVPARIGIQLARSRMKRVFHNLILNAMEAMPGDGKIWISARERNDHVLIEVEDSGPGIPIEIRGRLFDPFVTSGKKDGIGLGLALSRHTVREHGGDMWTEPAVGARFVVSLPLNRSPRLA